MMPHVYHYITIYDKRTKKTVTEKHYVGGPKWGDRGEEWWSTYRYVRYLALTEALNSHGPYCTGTSWKPLWTWSMASSRRTGLHPRIALRRWRRSTWSTTSRGWTGVGRLTKY